jgi:hypothetical protein
MTSLPSHRPPRRTRMTIEPRWRMRQHLPVTEEEDWEKDNRRSERFFGYEPDRVVDAWNEYQAAMEDPMFAY